MKRREHVENLVEELALNGFDVKVDDKLRIVYDTIAGQLIYSCSENTYMGDFYRFIQHLGTKFSTWGLKNKIKQNK